METSERYLNLVFGCPNEKNNENCPFCVFRNSPYGDKIYKWNELTESEKEELIDMHLNCKLTKNKK